MKQRVLNNQYIVEEVIGKGGMAIVYKALRIDTREIVAIKMLKDDYLDDESFVERFKKEAIISGNIRHRNVVNTLDVGVDKGNPYIVMEFVEGRTLKDYIKIKKIIEEREAVNIAIQICDALSYAHSKKLVHRDIKPQNVLLRKDGVAKVGDFGIAKMTTSNTMTMSGTSVLGSVHYMSPEQARGGVVDNKADIYALGVVIYEMLTGTVPFKGDSPVSIALKHVQESISSPRTRNHNISVAIDKIVMKATNKSKDLRYDTADSLKKDLIMALEDASGDFVVDEQDLGRTREIPVITNEMLEDANQKRINKIEVRLKETKEKEFKQDDYSVQNDANKSQLDKEAIKKIRTSISKLLLFLILFATLVVLGITVLQNVFLRTPENKLIMVPNVIDTSIYEAQSNITRSGFEYEVEYVIDKDNIEGIVIGQTPTGDQLLDSKEKIKLYVSKGPELAVVPNVRSASFSQAIALIEEAGFEVGDVQKEVSDLPKEYIVRQDPEGETEIPIGDKIDIWISAEEDTTLNAMPNTITMKLAEALYLISSVEVNIVDIEIVEVNSGYDKNIVINQEPEADVVLDESQKVILYVSNGEEEKYSKEKSFLLTVEKDATQVKMVYKDDVMLQVIYEQVLSKGDHEITLTLSSNTPGDKEITIYYDGEEHRKDRITFEVVE